MNKKKKIKKSSRIGPKSIAEKQNSRTKKLKDGQEGISKVRVTNKKSLRKKKEKFTNQDIKDVAGENNADLYEAICKTHDITPLEVEFCKTFVLNSEFYGNGVASYIEVYGIDVSEAGAYGVARAQATNLLKKSGVINYISELMETGQLCYSNLEKQLGFLITQNADLNAKAKGLEIALKLYGKLQEKLNLVNKDGKDLQVTINVMQVNQSGNIINGDVIKDENDVSIS